VHGIVDRETRDLDFFAGTEAAVAQLLPALETALQVEGLAARREQVTPSFARLTVSDGDATTLVDLAWDYRLQQPVQAAIGRVVTEEELGADKLLALFGRAEPRDFLDVRDLAARRGLRRLCELAHQKDLGFTEAGLADSLGRFDRLDRQDLGLDAAGYRELQQLVAAWRDELSGHQP
jgi:hypothetical protein